MRRTCALIILDGWGVGEANDTNPVFAAHPKTFAHLAEEFPVTSLQASGIAIGLPWGEVGNSEVGHLTIGAGKVVYQYFPRITIAVQDGTFFENAALKSAFAHAKKNSSAVHVVGLLTDANVHASIDHLLALIDMAKREGAARVEVHLWSDGKDSAPRSFERLYKKIPRELIASVTGRYYAMDRMENWPLTEKAYECLVGKGGAVTNDFLKAAQETYAQDLTEEFIPPLRAAGGRGITSGDAVIFFNFREDGVRGIASAFTDPKFSAFPTEHFKDLYVATMTHYSEKSTASVAFPPDKVTMPLGRVIADQGKTQLRLAESYKYAHVTYFFNGYREEPFAGEYRAIIPSLRGARADEHPELQANAITDRLVEALQNNAFDLIVANYSNPDTIAHTGNFDACLEAVRIMDREIGRVTEAALESGALLLVTADHGNIEQVVNPSSGRVESQHDPNPVPFYIIGDEFRGRKFVNFHDIKNETTGILADIAPTVLELMGIAKPEEMTGRSLLKNLLR